MSTSISRRSLARGATWAAPALIASTSIPAYAASSQVCQTAANIGADTHFWYGTSYYDPYYRVYRSQPTTMTSQINDANITITGLEEGETIVSETFTWLVEDMPEDADRSVLPTGALSASRASRVDNGRLAEGWVRSAVSGPSWQTISVNGQTFRRNMWSVTFENPTGVGGSYLTDSDGCTTFMSGNFILRSPIFYRDNVMSLALPEEPIAIANQAFRSTVVTSLGKVIQVEGFLWDRASWGDQETRIS